MTNGNEIYLTHCIKCGTPDKLMMVPNRNGIGQMVGWHFVCNECFSYIAGKETRTEFGKANIDEKDIQ